MIIKKNLIKKLNLEKTIEKILIPPKTKQVLFIYSQILTIAAEKVKYE